MRILKLTLFLCFVSYLSFSQTEEPINQIDMVGAYVQNNVARFPELDGVGSVVNGAGFCLGANYSRKITKKIWINSGINFEQTVNDFNSEPTGMPIVTIENLKTNLLRAPLKIRIDLFRWFYLKTGFVFDYQLDNKNESYIDNQSGIAYALSVGLNLRIYKQIYLNLEPEIGYTKLVSFNPQENQQHFLLSTVNFGIGYRF